MAPFGTQTTSMVNIDTLHGCVVCCLTVNNGRSVISSDETSCSACWVDSSLQIQVKNMACGEAILAGTVVSSNNNSGGTNFFRYCIDCSAESGVGVRNKFAGAFELNPALFKVLSACGQCVTVQKKIVTGTQTMYGTCENVSFIEELVVGGGCFTVSIQEDELCGDDTTCSACLVDTSLSLTVPCRASGQYLALANLCNIISAFSNASFRFEHGCTDVTNGIINTGNGAGESLGESDGYICDLDGSAVTVRFAAAASDTTTLFGSCDKFARLVMFEVSGGTTSNQSDHNPTGNESFTCNCYVSSTLSVTMPCRSDGKFMALHFTDSRGSAAAVEGSTAWNIGCVRESGITQDGRGLCWVATMMNVKTGDLCGQSATVDYRNPGGGTTSFRGGGCCASRDRGHIITFEVSP